MNTLLHVLAALLVAAQAHTPRVGPPGDAPIDMIPGVVEAWQTVDLSTPTAGVISEIAVREMQHVGQDDVLILLDDQLAKASLAAAETVSHREASLRRASLGVTLAEKYLQRVREAHQQKAASGLELDEAQGRLEEARAGLANAHEQQREAEAQVTLERVRLQQHVLTAPFPGAVVRITGRRGATVDPDEPLLRLTNLSQLRVSLYVPVTYFGRLRLGKEYVLCAESPAPPRVAAVLIAQEPIIDAATETFRCIFEIDNTDFSLPAGFAVRLCEPAATDSSTDD